MEFLEQIKNLNDEELKKVVKERIAKLEAEKQSDDPDIIGFDLEPNSKKYDTYKMGDMKCFELNVISFYAGYIKKGTKIVYGIAYDENANAKSEGSYYYMDDEEYIYEFCKFIRDKEVTNQYELFDYILEFLRGYFGVIESIPRSDMFKLLYKDENTFFEPINEHSIKDFKGKGNALCTEYAATAQNIMSLFDVFSYMLIGQERLDNSQDGYHAFNFISFDEQDSKEEVNALIDYSAPVNLYDVNFEVISVCPFISYLDDFDEKFVYEFLYENKDIEVEDYGYLKIGDRIMCCGYERNRHYYMDGMIYCHEKVKK